MRLNDRKIESLTFNILTLFTIFSVIAPPRLMAQESGEFHPAIVSTASGDVDFNTRRLLVENFSDAIRTSSLRSLAKEFYGTSTKDGFAGVGSKGPIGMLRNALISLDHDMAERVVNILPELKAPTSTTSSSMSELFWTRQNVGTPALGANSNALSVLLGILGPSMRKSLETNHPFALQTGQKALNLTLATSDQVPGGRALLLAESADAYGPLKELNDKSWIPLHLESMISFDQSKNITTRIAITMLPVGFKVDKSKVGDFSIESITYQPERDNRSVVRVIFERSYGADSGQRPPMLIKVNFGPLERGSTDANICIGDACLNKADSIPTIHALMDAGWVKNSLAQTLSLNSMMILISSLGINIETMSVDPATSELPILMKTYTFGWKIIDSKRFTRPLNPLEALQKIMVGDQVSASFSSRLQAEGSNAENRVNESLQSIIDLFR